MRLDLRRIIRHASLLLFTVVLLTTLSGCDEKAWRELVLVLLVVLVLAAAVQLAFLTVMVVAILKLVQEDPSMKWGIAALVCGAFDGLPSLLGILRGGFDGIRLAGLVFGGALAYVGWRNVKGALPLPAAGPSASWQPPGPGSAPPAPPPARPANPPGPQTPPLPPL